MEWVLPWYAHEAAAAPAREAGAVPLRAWLRPAAEVQPADVDDDKCHALACHNGCRAGKAEAAERRSWQALGALRRMLRWLEADDAQRRVEAVSRVAKRPARLDGLRGRLLCGEQIARAVIEPAEFALVATVRAVHVVERSLLDSRLLEDEDLPCCDGARRRNKRGSRNCGNGMQRGGICTRGWPRAFAYTHICVRGRRLTWVVCIDVHVVLRIGCDMRVWFPRGEMV